LPLEPSADILRFHNFHDHWLWRLLTEVRGREVCVRLLGVVGTRDDDHPGVRYIYFLVRRFSIGGDMDVVLQDAFSTKYKSAVHSGVFENAVKKYRKKMKNQSKNKTIEMANEEFRIPVGAQPSLVEESSARAQRNLESLPGRVLDQARDFHRYIHYLVQAEPEGIVSLDLKLMLDDIGRGNKLDEKMKGEILQDKDARNVSTSPVARRVILLT
jgi:hypothetical protein